MEAYTDVSCKYINLKKMQACIDSIVLHVSWYISLVLSENKDLKFDVYIMASIFIFLDLKMIENFIEIRSKYMGVCSSKDHFTWTFN